MWPRLREQGYLAAIAKQSAGRRPAVSSARVWPGSSVLAAYGVCSHGSGSVSVIEIMIGPSMDVRVESDQFFPISSWRSRPFFLLHR